MANEVQVMQGKEITNPYRSAEVVKSGNENAVIAGESQRSMTEVMIKYEMAKRFPRDTALAADKILKECARPTLAELATYSYPRGGEKIEGATIRLMEAIARGWGNIDFGWQVLAQGQGRTIIEAYAIDLENNINRSTTFEVKHWRDTKKGGYALKDERDIFEVCSNNAMRRVRACIEGLIPRDVIDMALEACERTSTNSVDSSPAGIAKLLGAFAAFGVNRAMIENLFGGLKVESFKAPQIVSLRKKHASIKDGMGAVEDFFDTSLADKPEAKKEETQPDLKKEIKKDQKPSDSKTPVTPKADENPQDAEDVFPADLPFTGKLA